MPSEKIAAVLKIRFSSDVRKETMAQKLSDHGAVITSWDDAAHYATMSVTDANKLPSLEAYLEGEATGTGPIISCRRLALDL